MRFPFFSVLLAATLCGLAHAHPLPEIPIYASFDGAGGLSIRTEIDPRCFEPDPNVAPSVTQADFTLTPSAQRDQWKAQASEYIRQTVRFILDGAADLNPAFEWSFTTHENMPLANDEDVVVLTGTSNLKLPAAATGFSIEATKAGSLSVLLRNAVRNTVLERFQVLFPSETSYVLDLTTWQPRTPPPAVIEAKDDEPADSTNAPLQSSNKLGMISTLFGIALVAAWLALRAKRIKQS